MHGEEGKIKIDQQNKWGPRAEKETLPRPLLQPKQKGEMMDYLILISWCRGGGEENTLVYQERQFCPTTEL